MDEVVLVDEQDKYLGTIDKVEAHLGEGHLHRAFTVFVFNSAGETLLTQRSASKMLWPLIWDSACASHPSDDEGYEAAGERRLSEELDFTCNLKKIDEFQYHAVFEDVGAENELCTTLLGNYDGEIVPNPDEVADYKWMSVPELQSNIAKNPGDYAIWLKIALNRMLDKNLIKLEGLK